jgi:hypothetical protein
MGNRAQIRLCCRQRQRANPPFFMVAPACLPAICRPLQPGRTVGGVQYDVATCTGTYNANISKFETAANRGVMPWWGDSTMAQAFAVQAGSSHGALNSNLFGEFLGYQKTGNIISTYRWDVLASDVGTGSVAAQFSRAWAQATLYTPPAAPGPLPLFGAAAGFGFSRKLRKRIQVARKPQVSNLPLA